MNTTVETSRGQKLVNGERTFSPDEVRQILNSDNQEIKKLCKQVCISPKRDNITGRTFFLKNDVEILKKIKDLHEKGQKIMDQQKEVESTAIATTKDVATQASISGVNSLVDTVIDAKNSIIENLSKLIDEKLDGMDEVVVELIRSKTENERLKQKLNQLTKENFKLKNDIESFKPVKFGLYIKK